MPAAHAAIGPSSAARWMTCTRSIQHSREHGVFKTNDAAEEGSLAHEVFEMNVIGALRAARFPVRRRTPDPDALLSRSDIIDKYDFDAIEQDVVTVVDRCLEHVRRDKQSQAWVEEKVTLGSLTDKVWGTADMVVWQPSLDELTIIDLKYGRVPVSPEYNLQLSIYALGAMASLLQMRRWPAVLRLVIAQPRTGDAWNEWVVDMEWLRETFLAEFKAALAVINTDKAEFKPSDTACKYCPGIATCPALLEEARKVSRGYFANLDDIAVLAEALAMMEPLEAFRKAVAEQATEMLASGTDIPGWKLVPGRTQRRWTDEESVINLLQEAGLEPNQYLKSALVGIPAVEKLAKTCDSVDMKSVAQYITRPDGKPTLAKATDKREAIKPTFSPIDDNDTNV